MAASLETRIYKWHNSAHICSNLMVMELIFIKPKAINIFMPFEKLIGGLGQKKMTFHGYGKVRKGI